VTKKISGVVYGRECGQVLIDGETVCLKHNNKKQDEYTAFWKWCCDFKIKKCGTGVPKKRSRKGLCCGEFCKEGQTKCSVHIKNSTSDEVNRVLRCLKVRTFPTPEQKNVLEKFFGDTRKTYNLIVDQGVDKITKKLEDNLKSKFVSGIPEDSYLRKTPKDIRDSAVTEYVTGLENAIKQYERKVNTEECIYKTLNGKYRKKIITKPEMKYRLKRESQSITVPHRSAKITEDNKVSFCPRSVKTAFKVETRAVKKNKLFKEMILKNKIVYHDFKVIKTTSNKYYFCFSYEPVKQLRNTNSTNVCSIDPGVRTAFTAWSPQGTVLQIGKGAGERFKILRQAIYELQKKQKVELENKNYTLFHRLRNRKMKFYDKLKNIVNDLHYKTIKELERFDTIILPWFHSNSIKKNKDLPKSVILDMQILSHNKFRNRLINKAIISGQILMIPADEFKTTMTCHRCFSENPNVGANKVFHCNNCKLVAGRDINAALNIFIRQVEL